MQVSILIIFIKYSHVTYFIRKVVSRAAQYFSETLWIYTFEYIILLYRVLSRDDYMDRRVSYFVFWFDLSL